MIKKYIYILLCLTFVSFAWGHKGLAQTISRKVISNAGGTLTGGDSQLTYNIGETFIPSLSAGDNLITQGFEQPGEQIKTDTVSAAGCGGGNISVQFTAIDMGGGNTYTAQLSDGTGSFANPVNIGSLTGNMSSGAINASIPVNTPAGSGYRIRVVGSNPVTTGTDNGSDITVSAIDFNGQIKFSNNTALGVKNVLVSLTGTAAGSNTSDLNGNFAIPTTVSGGSFTLKPTKTINKLNGITVADATAVQQHVASIAPITDLYKLVAADVNKSNSVNILDASIINQALLGNPGALVQFKTSWRFVPTDYTMTSPPWGFPEVRTYTNIDCTTPINPDFYGIKIGDVVTTFANPANFGDPETSGLVLHAQDRLLRAGETFDVEFSAEALNDLAAFQLALVFNPAQLQFEAVEPLSGLPLSADHFSTYNAANGEIRAVWSQPTGRTVPAAAPVFRLRFKAIASGGELSEALSLGAAGTSELPALAYNSALEESPLRLTFMESTGTGNPAAANGVQLFQNRPNPFRGSTAIGFVLPEACSVRLCVFDVSGRKLAEHKGQYPAGNHEISFDLGNAQGMLYYELTTPFGVLSRKMAAVEK